MSTYFFHLLCKAVKSQIKNINAHGLHPVSFPPQTPVDAVCCVLCLLRPSLCFHACKQLVESCVSATCLCWREMRSITGQGCYPGAWAQPCTVISSHLPLFYDRTLREGPSNYLPLKNTALPLHTQKKTTYVWVRRKISTGRWRCAASRNFINYNLLLITPSTLEIEPRRWGCISVQISVGIIKQLWVQVTDLISARPLFLRWSTAASLRSQSPNLHIIRRQEAARFSDGF